MGEVGYGLLNAELLKAVKRVWGRYPVVLLFLHIRLPQEKLEEAMRAWEREERGLFWKQRLGQDYVFFLTDEACSAQEAGESSGKLLRAKLAKAYIEGNEHHDHQGGFHISRSIITPQQGVRAEDIVFRALLQACEQRSVPGAMRHDPMESAAGSLKAESMPDGGEDRRIGQLASPIATVPHYTHVSEVANVFERDALVPGVVVLKNGKPVGLLMKEKLHQLLAGQYGLPLYWNRPVEKIMDAQALIVDESMPVEQVSQLAMSRTDYRLYDVVILTRNESLLGVATIRSMLEYITALRTEEARTANPLTGLPGNEGIHSELTRKIKAGKPFAMLYADLDYFKWFNDCFGFGLGDDLIRYVAKLLRTVLCKEGRSSSCFLGHIGGDDFIAILDPHIAEEACRELIQRFDQGVVDFYGGAEVTEVEDRRGARIQQDGVSISLSILYWDGIGELSPEVISRDAAKLKKQAKAIKGSVYVMENITEMHRREERTQS
ncbi:GGDEF domain-containing protein [Paenibacillus sp. PL2-23]|uniref:GGDEF domain-containing protein n=1 Tax=Paenibacillus sp. PL2-23 TaxID=2100729 RepID=UPI0030FBF5C3